MPQLTIQQAFDLAVHHHKAGRLNEAVQLYRQILARQPQHADALHGLGVAAAQMGRHHEAADLIRQAIAFKPNWAQALNNLGNALRNKGDLDGAIAAYRQALALNSNFAALHTNLGNTLEDRGCFDQAVAAHRQALALEPNFPELHYNLGHALKKSGQLDEAIAAFRRALALKPNLAEAHCTLGDALTEKGLLDEAIAALRQAIALKFNFPEAHCNLGNALKEMGCHDEAIAAFRQALALKPDYLEVHSNLIFYLYYHPGADASVIAHELRLWNHQYAEPLKKYIQPHANNRDPDRRLRIGYVSSDFHAHPVGRFLLPLLANHDHQSVEVFAYAQVPVPDDITQRLGTHVDAWRSVVGLSDAQAADLILRDRVDILVELTLHTNHNRLLIFARKPAPVQVIFLAYPGSSGFSAIDYRLSDPYLDPPGEDESSYSEQTIRLPRTYWCYSPVLDIPLEPLPCLKNGHITFGCLNNFCKVNAPLIDLWALMLKSVPHSRLLLHAHEGSHRQRVLDQMQREGIEPARVSFVEKVRLGAYFELYHSIDIALDTHPYAGGTTTCDALWMGVPVVSLIGKMAVGRGGLSILSNVGLPELAAHSPEEYVRIGVDLASDLPRLNALRSTLRQRMEASPLMDAPRFARDIESAYRKMWRDWCARQSR